MEQIKQEYLFNTVAGSSLYFIQIKFRVLEAYSLSCNMATFQWLSSEGLYNVKLVTLFESGK